MHHRPAPPLQQRSRESAAVRVSDAEREQAAERLRRHGGDGRLTVSELEQRLGLALSARTRGDLQALFADLPDRVRSGRRRPRSRWSLQPLFVALSALMVVIWAVSGAGYFWPVWPIMGMAWWGVPWWRFAFRGSCGRDRAHSGPPGHSLSA